MNRRYRTGAVLAALVAVLVAAGWMLQTASQAQTRQTVQGPMFQVDPFWPKNLPNNWVLGSVVGLSIDSRDHVWITHRGNVAPKEAGMLPGTNGTQQPGGSPPAMPGDKRRIVRGTVLNPRGDLANRLVGELGLLVRHPRLLFVVGAASMSDFALAYGRRRHLHDLSSPAHPSQFHFAPTVARISADNPGSDGFRGGGDWLGRRSSPSPRPLR